MHSVKKIVKYIEQISQLEHLQNKLKDDMIEGVLLRKVSQNKNKKEMILDEFIAQYGGTDPAPAPENPAPANPAPANPVNPAQTGDSSSQGASTTPTATPSTLAEMITNLSNITFTTLPNDISQVETAIKTFTDELTKTSNKIVNTIKALKAAHATELENSNVSNTQAITAKDSEISTKIAELKTLTENYNKINSYLNTLASASATTVNSVMDTLKNNGP